MPEEINKMKQSQAAKRKNLAEWRASRLHELTLPSGLPVKVRDIDMTDLLLTGQMPGSILEAAGEAAKSENSIDIEKIGLELMQTNGQEFAKMLNLIVASALVEPSIGEPDDTHIALSELSMSDKMAILSFVNREVEQLKPFREGQGEPVAAAQFGEGIRSEAKPVFPAADGNGGMAAG